MYNNLYSQDNMESFLNLPVPHIHDKIYRLLDVPSRRSCLQTSRTMRNFILDRQAMGKKEERHYNWFSVRRPAEILLGSEDYKNSRHCHILVDEDNEEPMKMFFVNSNKVFVSHSHFKYLKTFEFAQEIGLDIAWIRGKHLLLVVHTLSDDIRGAVELDRVFGHKLVKLKSRLKIQAKLANLDYF